MLNSAVVLECVLNIFSLASVLKRRYWYLAIGFANYCSVQQYIYFNLK